MPKIAALLSFVACVMAGGVARGAEATGWITGTDSENDEIVLGNGQIFAVPDEIGFPALRENACVRIRYQVEKGVRIMTEITLLMTAEDARNPPSNTAERAICDATTTGPGKAGTAAPG